MSDRLDKRSARAWLALLAAALLPACHPHDPAQIPVPPDGGTPCTRAVAVEASTVVITAASCNPWCIHVPPGTAVTFLNGDPSLYYLTSVPSPGYDLQVPGYAGTMTLPLATGTWVWTGTQWPSVTVTIFVE